MTELAATTGQPFNSLNFGEGATTAATAGATRIEGHLDVVSTSPDILNLTSRVWFDDNGDGVFNSGDYDMGTVVIEAGILAQTLPNGITFMQAEASGHARATFTDDRLGQVVATATLAAFHFNYSITDTGTGPEYTLLNATEVNPMTIFAEDDSVTLANAANRFYDQDGALNIIGGTVNDTIVAMGDGVDSIYGGTGNDVIRFQGTGHTLNGGGGNDRILNVGNVTGDGTANITGGAGNDFIQGTSGADYFNDAAGSGDDLIMGGAGADMMDYSTVGTAITMLGGHVTGGSGDDTLQGVEHVLGTTLADIMRGGAGADILEGNESNDTIAGGLGADKLYGGDGVDWLSYSADTSSGVDVNLTNTSVSHGEADGDLILAFENVVGGSGNDSLTGDGLANFLHGGAAGRDVLAGMDGNDTLSGGRAVDVITGGGGNDRLIGGGGADLLTGGTGDDRFVFLAVTDSQPGRADVIADFRQIAGNRDVIDLTGLDAISTNATLSDAFVLTSGGGTGAFTHNAGELRWFNGANTTLIRGDVTGDGVADFQITLTGIKTLTAADFDL